MNDSMSNSKKVYVPPTITSWGNVHDLTATGSSGDADDTKGGSVASQGE